MQDFSELQGRGAPSMWERFLRALLEIIAHTVLVLTLLGCFWAVEHSIRYFWGPNAKVFWGVIEMRSLFDAAYAAALIAFFVSGLWHTLAAYNGWNE
jgi:hypothetical protein